MSYPRKNKDGSLTLRVDRKIFSRPMVKAASVALLDRSHVALDLDSKGNVLVTLSCISDQTPNLREIAGHFGNLLVAELATRKLDGRDEQTRKGRNLLVARALDGALPKPPVDCLEDLEAPCVGEAHEIDETQGRR